jgi:DNA polymerase-3 subunit theta
MGFKLYDLPPEDKTLIEVDKAAAYAVWKEHHCKLPTAELASATFTDHQIDGVH